MAKYTREAIDCDAIAVDELLKTARENGDIPEWVRQAKRDEKLEVWPHDVTVWTAGGKKTAHPGGVIVRYASGKLAVYTKERFADEFTEQPAPEE